MTNKDRFLFYQDAEKQELFIHNPTIMESGCLMWLPNGLAWKETIYNHFVNLLERHRFRRYSVPTILPYDIIEKLKLDLKDFTSNIHEINDKQGRSYYLNSTTDPVINYFLKQKKIIPFKGYFRGKLFRKGRLSSKKPFINSDEMVDSIEVYYIDYDLRKTEDYYLEAINLVRTFLEMLGIAFLEIDQAMWGNNPFSKEVTSFQTYLPLEKRSTRMASVYFHDQTFAQCFDLRHKDSFVHQIAFGFTERFLATLLEHHRDKYGFYFSSATAIYQVSIIPTTQQDYDTALRLREDLRDYSISLNLVYESDFYTRLKQELNIGSLVHIVVEDNVMRISNRINPYNAELSQNQCIVSDVDDHINRVDSLFKARSKELLNNNIKFIEDIDQIRSVLDGFSLIKFSFCGLEACGKIPEEKFPGEVLGFIKGASSTRNCLFCNEKSKGVALFGRRTSSS